MPRKRKVKPDTIGSVEKVVEKIEVPKDLSPGATERFIEIYNSDDLEQAKEFSEIDLDVIEDNEEIKAEILSTINNIESNLIDKKAYKEFVENKLSEIKLEPGEILTNRYGSQGKVLNVLPTYENLDNLEEIISEILKENPLTPLPPMSEAGLKMFDEAFKDQVSKMSQKGILDSLVSKEPSKWVEESEARAKAREKQKPEIVDEIELVSVIGDYSTLLEFYQARKCSENHFIDFIPMDYVDMDEESGIIKSINFAFMIPFDVIKGDITYCTLADEQFILDSANVHGIPSRYDIIDHGITTEARFNVEGKYDVKTLFDESLTILQSSLFSNHKIAK